MPPKFTDLVSAVVTILGLVTTVATFIATLSNSFNDPNMLHNLSVGTFLLFVISILWFYFKSSFSVYTRGASLVILYIFSAIYFVWVGTWQTRISSEQLSSAKISKPTNGEVVEMYTPFLMEYSNIPANKYLWVVIHTPTDDRVYLWKNDEFQNGHSQVGTVSSTFQIGSTTSAGHIFNIIVLLVDEKVNFSFQEYEKQCNNLGQCNGIILPETGLQILDFSTITRK